MDQTKGITVKVDASLHARAKADQEAREMTMNQYISMLIEEHFTMKGPVNMNTRTMAFQIDEELFTRIKTHLTRTGLTQKDFVLGLIKQALDSAEEELCRTQEQNESAENEHTGDISPEEEPEESFGMQMM